MISLLDSILILLIFILGIFSSLSDIKTGKIPNKLLLFFFLIGFPFRFFQIFFEKKFLFFSNFFFSLIISFLLWQWGIWGAADGKLFILYSFLIPLKFYPPFPLFPSLIILRNLIFPVVLFSFGQSLKDLPLILKETKKSFFSLKRIIPFFKDFLFFFSSILVFASLFNFFEKSALLFQKFIFLLLFLLFFFFLLKIKSLIFLIFLGLAFFFVQIFLFKNFFLKFISKILIITFLFLIFRKWLSFYLQNYGFKKIPLSFLKEGLEIPKSGNEKIFEILAKKEEKIKLKKDEIEKIKSFLSQDSKITIYTTFPFSLFLFLAVLILLFQKFLLK